jgi:hypothetical protein
VAIEPKTKADQDRLGGALVSLTQEDPTFKVHVDPDTNQTLISGMGLNITLMSYAGQVVIGYTCNASALPDADRLARYTRAAFAALERRTKA